MKSTILLSCFMLFLVLNSPVLLADNAPVTTAGNAVACSPGGNVTVPVTVTGFNNITSLTLRLDYDPSLMTFTGYSNANPALAGLMVNNVPVSSTLHKVFLLWAEITPVTLTSGSTLVELNFTYGTGTGTLSFNNSSNNGGDCEYTGATPVPLNDLPTATYYHDASISYNGVGPAGAISGTDAVCAGSTGVVYSILPVSGATQYQWSYSGSGATINGTSNIVTVNYASTATSGNLTVRGANTACGQGTASPPFVVAVTPLPAPTITGPSATCDQATEVYSTESGMTGYLWSVSCGLIVSGAGTNSITVKWTTAGNGQLSVNYTNSGNCTALQPATLPVTVHARPLPTISGPTAVPVGSSGNVYLTEAGKLNYSWTVSSGGTITAGQGTNSATVTWNSPGGFFISVNYQDPLTGCTALTATSYTVTVGNVPTPPGPITGPQTVCLNSTGLIYSIAAIPNATGYSWSVPAGFTIVAGGNTPSITVNTGSSAVSGNVTVYGINSFGNGASSTLPVSVFTVPAAPGPVNGPEQVCAHTSGVGYSVASVPQATSYSWTLPVGAVITSGAGTNLITVDFGPSAQSGGISVSAVNGCGTGLSSPIQSITVNPVPETPVITVNGNLLTSNAPQGNQWYMAGIGAIPGATGPTYLVNLTGTYFTQVTQSGCVSDTSNHMYVVIDGVEDQSIPAIVIFPNPCRETFSIVFPGQPASWFTVELFNLTGSMVFSRQFRIGDPATEIDPGAILPGWYAAVLTSSSGQVVRKMILIIP